MKAKLVATAVLTLLAAGAAHAQGRSDSPRSSGAVISNITGIGNDVHVQGYGLALDSVPFSSESSAVVDSTQSSNSNSVDLQRGSNTATVDGQALKGAQGTVGVSVMSGTGNVQSNSVALVAVNAGKVFASVQVFDNQADPGKSLSIGSALNEVSLDGNALNGAKDTIGAGIAAGAGEPQKSGVATSTNTPGRIARATDYNKQSADNNSLRLNGCDPTNVTSLSGTAPMNTMDNIGVNIAASTDNLQHNDLTIAMAKAAN